MYERHELRWGGLAGLGFVVLGLIAQFLPGLPPAIDSSAGEITAYFADGRGLLLTAALLWSAAAVLVVWFTVAFAEAIRERVERSNLHLVLVAGGVLVGGVAFINAAVYGVTAFGIDGRAAGLTVLLFEFGTILITLIGVAAALPLTAAGLGVLRTHMMPDWLGYLAFLAAVVSVVGAFGIYVSDGAFVAGGMVMGMVPFLLTALWILCGSYYMVREHLPEVSATTAMPQT
ncbi:MAG: hypothetical protein ACRDOY_06245 [Nocardioidaceae bacterium]